MLVHSEGSPFNRWQMSRQSLEVNMCSSAMCSIPDDPESSRFQREMEDPGAKRRRKSQYDIFLSHSGQEKAFVEQLFYDLKRMNQRPFFDQDSDCLQKAEKFAPAILDAAKQCRVGVVVVSEGYLTSKWPMVELSKFVECGVPVFPLFLKLSPGELKGNEVETKWKQSWRHLVETGEVGEEVVELWSKAVKELRTSNGLEFERFAKSEYRYRCAVVEEICKRWPPILEWSMDGIQGYSRLCEATSSMFLEAKVGGKDRRVGKYLGIYGMGGLGKTTLCKSMCSYFLGKFGGRVLYLELPSEDTNDRKGSEERLARLKHVVQQLARVDKSVLDSICTEEQGWACLKDRLGSMPPVFLAIDNVGEFAASREEAQRYLKMGLPSGSKVLVTARSQKILNAVLGEAECCKPIPRLEWVEAATLFLSYAAPSVSSVSCLKAEEREIVEKCLSRCRFEDSGYPSRQYHPLVLKALGKYFEGGGGDDVMSWGEALESWKKVRGCGEATSVNDILGLSYRFLSDQEKLVFLDSVLYYNYFADCFTGWWRERQLNKFEEWVSKISEVHGVSPFEAKGLVKKLQRLSLVEDSDSEVSIHDLYREFARALVEKEGSREWQWWMSRSSDQTQLKRLVLDSDESIIGVAPRRFLEWRSLVVLDLLDCDDVGPELELGSFHSLRTLSVIDCPNVKRITCSCNKDYADRVCCYKKNPGRGWMSELVTVHLRWLESLEGIPFMWHCWNLRHFLMYSDMLHLPWFLDSECDELKDFRYLQVLESFYLFYFSLAEHNRVTVSKWLQSALQLRNLVALSLDCMEGVLASSYTLDLNEVVGLSTRLYFLSVRLPGHIHEVKGLHLLSELIRLDLQNSKGLRHLPDLRCLPKLKWLCVVRCCELGVRPSVGPGVQGICDSCVYEELDMGLHYHDYHENCLDPYCYKCDVCLKRMRDECDSEDDSEGIEPAAGRRILPVELNLANW